MKKKIVSVLLTTAMVATLAAGCGSSDSGSSDSGSSDSGKEMTYWSMWNSTEPQAKVIQEAADAYEEETGIHINIEWKGRDMKTLIGTALDPCFPKGQCRKFFRQIVPVYYPELFYRIGRRSIFRPFHTGGRGRV